MLTQISSRAPGVAFLRFCCAAAAWMAVALMLAVSAEAEKAEKTDYDIPEGKALKTLKTAARQGGVDLVFNPKLAKGVTTCPINGRFTPREALERMLEGYGLAVVHDAPTGAYTLRRAAEQAEAESAASSVGIEKTDTNPKEKMLMKKEYRQLGELIKMLVAAAVTTSTAANAQEEGDEGDDIFELSPFQVDASEDEGYRATSTLAGTRIRTDLRDVASAIQIVTSEFIEDTAATDAESLFVYTTNTEVAGLGGNFTGTSSTSGGGTFFNAPRNNLADEVRVRGIAAPDTSRDFFATEIPMDTFNVESVAVNRGANSVLFGLGSPAGILEYDLKSPMAADRNKIELRAGSFGSWRSAVDVNRTLLGDALKVRVIGLMEEEKFEQDVAYERDERVFATVEYSPKWDETLTFRTSYERGEIDASRPVLTPPIDRLSPWWEYGQLTYDPSSVPARPDGFALVDPATGVKPFSQFGNTFQEGQVVFADPFSGQPGGNNTPDGITSWLQPVFTNGGDFFYGMLAPSGTGILRAANSDVFGPGSSSFINQTISDERIFDFRNRNVMGRTQSQNSDFDEFTLKIEKLFFEKNVGIELAYNSQTVDRGNLTASGGEGSGIAIDINERLFNGEPNPNFGRPFVATRTSISESGNDSESLRATAFARYDFRDRYGDGPLRFLGEHTATGLFEKRTRDSYGFSFLPAAHPESFLNSFNEPLRDPSVWDVSRSFQIVKYLGDPLDGLNSATEAASLIYGSASPVAQLPQDVSDALTFVRDPVDGAGGAWQRGQSIDFLTYWDNRDQVANNGRHDGLEVESTAFVLNSSWLSESITTVLGYRSDTVKSLGEAVGRLPSGAADVNQPNTVRDRFAEDNETSADTFTWGVVLHANALPGVGDILPDAVDLRLHAGESENFSTGQVLQNVWGERLASQGGTTEEMGFSLNLLDGKLDARVNWYETAQTNVPVRGFNYWAIWLLPQIVYDNNTDAEREAAGWTGLPEEVAAVTNFDIGELRSDGTRAASHDGSLRSNVADTQDLVGTGVEIELVYNPIDNWTIMLSAAQQEAAISNTIPGLRRFFDAVDPAWRQAGDELSGAGPLTLNERRDQWLTRGFESLSAQEGALNQEVREWRYKVVTNYSFASDSKLKGFNVGGAYRWQDEAAIGASFDEDFELDSTNPHFGPTQTNVDAWIGYSRMVFNDRVDWRLQLNVRNLLDDDDLVPTVANPDGSIAVHRIPAPRTWALTSTFEF